LRWLKLVDLQHHQMLMLLIYLSYPPVTLDLKSAPFVDDLLETVIFYSHVSLPEAISPTHDMPKNDPTCTSSFNS
jgi:hypothetical protein